MTADDVKVQFGNRVRHLRKARGVSQEAFAHAVGIDRSYYGSIERGERNVSLENICLIAAGLEVPPCELLRFDAEPAPALDSKRSSETRRKTPRPVKKLQGRRP